MFQSQMDLTSYLIIYLADLSQPNVLFSSVLTAHLHISPPLQFVLLWPLTFHKNLQRILPSALTSRDCKKTPSLPVKALFSCSDFIILLHPICHVHGFMRRVLTYPALIVPKQNRWFWKIAQWCKFISAPWPTSASLRFFFLLLATSVHPFCELRILSVDWWVIVTATKTHL